MGTDRRAIAITSAALLALAIVAPASAQDASPAADGQLARILESGVIRMSTDPAYPPQSFLDTDGTLKGFDIDVGTEIATRLGVDIVFETPDFALVSAGNWSDRWDFSVGSVTITSARQEVLDFTQPYYFTPAQFAVPADSGYDSLDDLAGKTVCMGEGTTYLDWYNGELDFGTETPDAVPPEGSVATTLPTDRNCAESWAAGRRDFEGWLTAAPTVQGAIDEGLPVVAIGDPVFYEPLAAAFDRNVEDNDSLVAAVDAIIGEMHADGTLSALSQTWYGIDLTMLQGSESSVSRPADVAAPPQPSASPEG
jgi:polar amino acid transport system substrate-binding protein